MASESLDGQTRKTEHMREPWYERPIERVQDVFAIIRFEVSEAFQYIGEAICQRPPKKQRDES